MAIYSVNSVEEFHNLIASVKRELGNSDKYWKVIAHITEDVLDIFLERIAKSENCAQSYLDSFDNFAADIISFNKEAFQEKLLEKVKRKELNNKMVKFV